MGWTPTWPQGAGHPKCYEKGCVLIVLSSVYMLIICIHTDISPVHVYHHTKLLTYLPADSTHTPTYTYVHAPGKILRGDGQVCDNSLRFAQSSIRILTAATLGNIKLISTRECEPVSASQRPQSFPIWSVLDVLCDGFKSGLPGSSGFFHSPDSLKESA